MIEEVKPFEEYKEMIKDMRKEEMIKGLYDLSARVIKQENIIKEVREYIESYMPNYDFDKTNLIKLLEILGSDKE